MAESSPNLSFPITLQHEHRLIFTREVFAAENLTLAEVLTPREPGQTVRALVFWDRDRSPELRSNVQPPH